jgi:signal transduction histidine kinase
MAGKWNLQSISIKTRLRVFFSALAILMLLGSIISYRQFRNVSGQATRVARAEQRITALLRLNNHLITLMRLLHRAAEHQDPDQFEQEANNLFNAFQRQSAVANTELLEIAKENETYAVLVSSIQSMLEGLPGRVSAFIQIARQQDWNALRARLLNQADHTDDVVAALVAQAEADLSGARQRLIEDLEQAQRLGANVLALAAVAGLALAALLGSWVTHSITRPLSHLVTGSRALAEGQFTHRVPVNGSDELAHLALVFNRTAEELARLFEEVRDAHAAAEAAQSDLERHAKELARANSDLQQFAYSASHDLQEPLRTVGLYSELLRQHCEGKLDEEAEEYIGFVLRASSQMQQLIADLLAYTQATTAGKDVESVTDVEAVLQRVLYNLEPNLRAQSGTVMASPLPKVKVRDNQIQQLLQNLIGNALKYHSDRDPEIHISAEPQGNYWLFAVRDNGIGIDPQYGKQIFGIFKRLHGQEYPGTGIGLAICQRIVEGYGGKIWVESSLGQGSTFWFTLPSA